MVVETLIILASNLIDSGILYSLDGPLQDLVNREHDKAAAEYSSLELKMRSMEEKVSFATKQSEAAQKDAQEWKKRYELSMSDYKKSSESSAAQYATLQSKVTTLEERHSTTTIQMEKSKKEASEWQSKYEHILVEQRNEEERAASELKVLQVKTAIHFKKHLTLCSFCKFQFAVWLCDADDLPCQLNPDF